MWQPEETEQTELDVPEGHEPGESMAALWGKFLGLAAIVTTTGWVVGRAGVSVIEVTDLSGTVVGAFGTSVRRRFPNW
ncbi:MAG: hypothetical protein M3N32_10965 [Actinomycetota bacterium]|nr:hypothetical protein [Actinomycetota bacterium]